MWRRRDLAGRGLDEVGAGGHREHRAPSAPGRSEPSSPVSRIVFRCAVAARLLGRRDLLERLLVTARQERRAVEHDVDLVGAVGDGAADLGEAEIERRTGPTGTRRRRSQPCTPVPATASAATRDERRDTRTPRRPTGPSGRAGRAARPLPRGRAPCPACRRLRGS